jgi:uncharacterized protein YodC (DUF2158 family)
MTEPLKRTDFVEGQTVVLRSGSPLMIVEDFGHVSDSVNVVWFDKSQVRRDAFHYLGAGPCSG